MGKRVIRLTESELMQLVGRIVKEQQETEMQEGFLSDSIGWFKDAVREVADLFKTEYMDEMDEEDLEDLKMAAGKINVKEVMSNLPDFASSDEGKEALEMADEKLDLETLSEGYLTEGWFTDNVKRVLARTGIITGLGMFAGGLMTFITQLDGKVDVSEFLFQVKEIVEASGCHAYCCPLALLAMVVGVVLALKSAIFGGRIGEK